MIDKIGIGDVISIAKEALLTDEQGSVVDAVLEVVGVIADEDDFLTGVVCNAKNPEECESCQ